MENGIYTRRDYQIVLYEKEGVEPFVVINNDGFTNYPIVLTGKDAEKLILAIATCLNVDDKEKGS